MVTVGTLVDEVRNFLNEPDSTASKFYTDAEIIKYIQRSVNDLCIDTDVNYRLYEYVVPTNLNANISSATAGATTQLTLDITHGFVVGNYVYIESADGTMGTTVLNDNWHKVTAVGATTITIDAVTTGLGASTTGTVKISSLTFPILTGGNEEKLFELKYLLFRDKDWQSNYYLPLYRVTPIDNISYVSAETRNVTCVIFDDLIQLNKGIDAGDKIVISARFKKADVTADGDTYPLDATSEDATVKYATAMGFYKKAKMEIGDKWFAQWLDRKALIKNKTEKLARSQSPMAISMIKRREFLSNTGAFFLGQNITP